MRARSRTDRLSELPPSAARRRHAWLSTLCLLLLQASATACAADLEHPQTLNLWPFYFHQKAGGRTDLELLGPLYYREKTPDRTAWGLRPFYFYRHENQPPKTSAAVLWPLSDFRCSPEHRRSFFFPFYFHDWRIAPNGKPVSSTVVFPLYIAGESPTLGPWNYSLLWGGTIKGLFGCDEIKEDWAGLRVTTRTGDVVTKTYLLYSEQRGGDRWGVRLFPFYAHYERKDRWWNGYVLWPLFTYGQREASPGNDPADYFFFFPFYGRARSTDGNSGSVEVLWPLFNYAWNHRTGYRAWKLPFPLFSGTRSPDVQTTNLWPFWGRRQWKGGSENYVLGPLVYWATVRATNQQRDELKIFPFFTHLSRTEPQRGGRYSYWLFWPFWRSRTAQEGDRWEHMANSAHLAFFGDSEAFDRAYNPLLGLYEDKAASDGWRKTSALLGLYRSESAPGWSSASVGPLVSWSSGAGLTRVSFLLGSFQTGTREGRRGWRILFIPLGASLAAP